MGDLKECKMCCTKIPERALICTECNCYQNYRRYLNFSSTFLGLLVALISVLTFAIPTWQKVFWEPIVKGNSRLLEVDNAGFALISISNGGNVLFGIDALLTGTNDEALKFDMQNLESKQRVIEPNSIEVIKVPLLINNDRFSTDVENLVLIYQATMVRGEFCKAQLDIRTTDGNFELIVPDATTRGVTPSSEKNCPQKLQKLFTRTLELLSEDDEYLKTICTVLAKHPMNPNNPTVGEKCIKFGNTFNE